jgi:Flp pilus assembly protein TadG
MKSLIGWFEKFSSRDRRGAERRELPPLIAYYWDGAAPRAHEVRDISPRGLYVKTEERWYPGTLVRFTLQQTGNMAGAAARSIAVVARVVRWGADGVGLEAVSSGPGDGDPEQSSPQLKALDTFLKKLSKGSFIDRARRMLLIPSSSISESRQMRRPGERLLTRLHAGSEGGALVEFALCLPALLLILTGIASFGFALNNYLELTNAVQIGGEQLAIARDNTTDPCNTIASAVYKAAPYLKQSSISLTTVIYTSSTASASYPGATCSSSSTSTGAAGNLTQGQAAQVTATYPCSLSVYGANIIPGCTLHAQITEIVQ